MRIRRSQKELVTFHKTVAKYMAQGFPQYKAEERSWDHLFVDRNQKRLQRTRVAA